MIRYLSPPAVLLLPVTASGEGSLPTHRIPAELASRAVAIGAAGAPGANLDEACARPALDKTWTRPALDKICDQLR